MLRNFLKIVVRNLWRYKAYTFINIIGMGIGIAAMVWGFQTYRFSFSFDNFHPDKEQVYRALTNKEGAYAVRGIFPVAAVQAAKNEFPGIKETVRLNSSYINIKSLKAEAFSENVHFTDPAFFSFFNFPLIDGTSDLNDRSTILITERTAKKYFGNTNPIGKILTLYTGEAFSLPLTVKGVLKDVPVNSTIRFDFLTNISNQLKPDGSKIADGDWSWFLNAAFFKIPNAADVPMIAAGLKKYLPLQNSARKDWKASGFRFVTLQQSASWNNVINTNSLYERPDDAAAYGPLFFALLIFISACLNFSNTTVARANTRLKEIGIRKVMGSSHGQLIVQMLLECAFIVLAAIVVSVLFNQWWLPAFNKMFTFIDIKADYLHDTGLLIYLGVMLIGATLLAGAYPAFYISRFNASVIFRGSVKFGGTNLFSRLMLGLQIAISIITVIGGIGFARNAAFQRNYDFGYNLESTMGVVIRDQNTFDVLSNEMKKVAQVTAIAGTRHHVGFNYRNVIVEATGVKKETNYLEVGKNYLKMMNLKMLGGRSFDESMQSDYTDAVLITQKMAALYGWKDNEVVGKQIHIDSVTYSVIGLLKDFHSNSFFDPVEPVVMKLVKEDRYQYLVIQAKPADLTNVYAKTKATWERLFPLKPFNGFYQNELTAESYRVTNSIASVFSWFSIVSVLLTATGLFALVSLTMMKKMKEIAVRKVVGANPTNILVLINKGYFWIFLVAAFLGCFAGAMLTKLMLDLIFKVNVGIENSTLIIAVIVLFLITAATTGIKVMQAIKINPVKLLRTD